MCRRLERHHRVRLLAVSLLIVGLLPAPWPKVEFHNVRHHDAPGQVCEYHDHLLRWHPDAGSAEDVAVLHWHWAWPSKAPSESGSGHDGDGPRLHAHLADDALPAAESKLMIVADTSARSFVPPIAEPPSSAFAFDLRARDLSALRSGSAPGLTFGATFAPRTSLTSRLHRWSC